MHPLNTGSTVLRARVDRSSWWWWWLMSVYATDVRAHSIWRVASAASAPAVQQYSFISRSFQSHCTINILRTLIGARARAGCTTFSSYTLLSVCLCARMVFKIIARICTGLCANSSRNYHKWTHAAKLCTRSLAWILVIPHIRVVCGKWQGTIVAATNHHTQHTRTHAQT